MELLTILALAATLAVPGRTNANVSLAAQGTTVVAVWSAALPAGPTDIYAAVSRDSGTTFGPPVRVNSTEGDAKVNGEQAPRVVLTRGRRTSPGIVVVWLAAGKPAGTTLMTARSDDGGKTFGKATLVPGSDAAGSRGWQSAAADPEGVVHALWLDHRGLAAPAPAGAAPPSPAPAGAAADQTHAGHMAAPAATKDPVAMAQKSALYTSVVGDDMSAHAITNGVCYCCKTAIVAGANGKVFAAWRQVYPGSVRDIAASISNDGGRTFSPPVKVSDDGWVLNGCPDDGPAMAIDGKGRLHIVWPTLVAGPSGAPALGLFYASSADGRTFSARQRVPTEGMPHHPQIAVAADGTVTVAWDETGGGSKQVVFARGVSDAAGQLQLTRVPAAAPIPGTYPVVVATPEGMLGAWTTGTGPSSAITVQRLPLR
jgi:hypothetical protein